MPQDTKSFLDITAIDTDNQLQVAIELAVHDHAVYNFCVNGIPLRSANSVVCVDLLSTIQFDCQVQTGAVEIVRIAVNGKEVMPIYLNQSDPPTSWITDTWTLAIPEPFYPWYHWVTGQGWTA
jgi:hypothetical protein